jgi:predicted lipoprotein with Yx(FWY)xxD motif
MRTLIGLRATAAGLFTVALLAGCGGGGTGSGSASESATGGAATSESGSASTGTGSAESGEETVTTTTAALGTFLVDADGMTLYRFTKDSPGKSTCEGDCAAMWPAVKGPAKAGSGVDASLLGTTQRNDGSTQATYKDAPLYYFGKDKSPGDVMGQGIGDVWWVISPQGEPIMTKAPAATSSSSSGY